jgi:sugar/nucleoside kinase (ribokinase family)
VSNWALRTWKPPRQKTPKSPISRAIDQVREDCRLAAVTRSEHGSIVVTREETVEVHAVPVESVVDTTGAGDLYAAGFLYGHTHGFTLGDCARLGSFAAALVIQQIGPRPSQNLKQAAIDAGYL